MDTSVVETGVTEATIVQLPVLRVVGMLYRGKNEHGEIPSLWERFLPRSGAIKHPAQPSVYYGLMDNYNAQTGEFDYLAGQGVEQVAGVPEGMKSWEFPPQTYAVFPCIVATIRPTMQYVYETWLPQSGYQRAAGPDFEFYDEHYAGGESPMALYIPVTKTM